MKLEHFQEEADGEVKWNFGKLYVEQSTLQDAHVVSRRLRCADLNEITAVTKRSPLCVLIDGVNQSKPCFTIKTSTGIPCGIFGTRDSGHSNSGVVWMLGTDDLTAESRTFIRHSRRWLNELHKNYRLLYNVIDARNEVHLKWRDWMGFDFIKEVENYGVEKRKFILFRRYV